MRGVDVTLVSLQGSLFHKNSVELAIKAHIYALLGYRMVVVKVSRLRTTGSHSHLKSVATA